MTWLQRPAWLRATSGDRVHLPAAGMKRGVPIERSGCVRLDVTGVGSRGGWRSWFRIGGSDKMPLAARLTR